VTPFFFLIKNTTKNKKKMGAKKKKKKKKKKKTPLKASIIVAIGQVSQMGDRYSAVRRYGLHRPSQPNRIRPSITKWEGTR